MNLLFEPMTSCCLHLSVKVVFLMAIASAGRVGELRALMADSPYIVFHRDKVSLRMHSSFLTKVYLLYFI